MSTTQVGKYFPRINQVKHRLKLRILAETPLCVTHTAKAGSEASPISRKPFID